MYIMEWFKPIFPPFLTLLIDSTPNIRGRFVPPSPALQSALNRCTVQPFTESDNTRCCVNAIFPPEDGHVNVRNMSRIIM
jgi:hypothetical protein